MTRSALRLGLLLLGTFGCLAWVLAGLEPHSILGAIQQVDVRYLLPVCALITTVFLLRVVRFQLLLGDVRPPFTRQLVVCGIAFLAINVAPFRLGELVRSFMLLDDEVDWGRSLGAVAVERVLDLLALLGMLALVGFAVDLPAAVVVQGIDVLAAGQRVIGIALVVLITLLVAVLSGGERVLTPLARIPAVGPRVLALSQNFRGALQHLAERPHHLVAAGGLAIAIWALTTVYVRWLLLAFPGMPTDWSVALAVTTFTVVGTVAIPTPGFFGPFEAFCKATLVLWAVDPAAAAALAILWHLLAFGFHAVTGGLLLLREGLSLGELIRASNR